MSNVWKVKVVNTEDKSEQLFTLRGPSNEQAAKTAAESIARAQRNRVIRDWGAEHAPILLVTDVQAAGNDDSQPGTFRPANARPIDLDLFTRQVSVKLGHGGQRPDVNNNAVARQNP